jgi:hypothetical protein
MLQKWLEISLRYESRSAVFWIQWHQPVRAEISRGYFANTIKYTLETSVADKM